MDLFVINRYIPSENEDLEKSDHVDRFLTKFSDKKLDLINNGEHSSSSKKNHQNETVEFKKKKKRKIEELAQIHSEESDDIVEKKKKKKKKHDIHSLDGSTIVCDNEFNNNVQTDNEELKKSNHVDSFLKKLSNKKLDSIDNDEQPTVSDISLLQTEQIDTVELKKKKKRKLELIHSEDSEDDHVKNKKKKKEKIDFKAIEGFTILGDNEFHKNKKVKRVLPLWLANPSIVSGNLHNLSSQVEDLSMLDKRLQNRLKKNGITHYFPVQSQLIPWLIYESKMNLLYRPSDICVSAPTGSGKTLAFVLPIVQLLINRLVPRIRALVVLPVQELASQVYSVFKEYTQDTDLKTVLINGKNTFQVEQGQLTYKHPLEGYQTIPDIVVATPGRLVDHLHNTQGLNLEHLRYLVIDEADRVMEHQQDDWLYHLFKNSKQNDSISIRSLEESISKRPPQKLLFSATLSQDPEKLQNLKLFQPRLFTSVINNNNKQENNDEIQVAHTFTGKCSLPAELKEYYLLTPIENKPLACFILISQTGIFDQLPKRILCFTNSQISAYRLAFVFRYLFKHSNINFKVKEMHSGMPKKKRLEILDKFKNGLIQVLVSSDALGRGIDLPEVDLVISYDPPSHFKTYIHRMGRTARAGNSGNAVTCLIDSQLKPFKRMLKAASKPEIEEINISKKIIKNLNDIYQKSLKKLESRIEKDRLEKKKKEIQMKRRSNNNKHRKKFKKNIQKYSNESMTR